jgi:hypothetical protein
MREKRQRGERLCRLETLPAWAWSTILINFPELRSTARARQNSASASIELRPRRAVWHAPRGRVLERISRTDVVVNGDDA